jgi:hypothetical protein
MTDTRLLVSVVDDDESVRESLPDLLKELGFSGSCFFLGGGISGIRHPFTDRMPDPRHCNARHERPGTPTRVEASPDTDANHLHHRSSG